MTSSPPDTRRILVVDDEPLVRQTLRLVLEKDYEVVSVGSGEEAVEVNLREPFPVVILDLCMAGLSGIETLRRLRKIHECQRVIILTAYESTESAIAALNLGAYNYLTKPFERTHLREIVARSFTDYEQLTARRRDFQRRLMGVHDEFFSLLCHEFNTPLNSILGFSELLAQSVSDPEHAEWADHVRASGQQLHGILMEIVDYIAAGHLGAAGIEKLFTAGEILDPIEHQGRERGITITRMRGPDEAVTLMGHRDAAALISRKLIDMASRRSRHVRLDACLIEQDGPCLEIRVGGTNIARGSLTNFDDLFEPYHPIDGDSGRAPSSLGLELAACRKIAEYAHAEVRGRLDSREELEFFVQLPVQIIADTPRAML